MCNNYTQQHIFGVKHLLSTSVDINALRFMTGINIDLGPQQTLNTTNP